MKERVRQRFGPARLVTDAELHHWLGGEAFSTWIESPEAGTAVESVAGAVADLSGLFFGVGEQILDQQITVVHDAPDCTSRQTCRGVLDDASTGVFNGGIDVCPGADGTDAEQSNDNLLLSNRAEVNTQPRLEILADEVACKHGATVGELDDTALYYLRSRGINADEARRLLINGFADQIVDDVSVDAVRDWITHRLGHDHD